MYKSYINDVIRHFLDLLKKLRFPVFIVSILFSLYHRHIINQLNSVFYLSLQIYKKAIKNQTLTNNSSNNYKQKIIWIFWWQGTQNMPKIVRRCIQSIVNNSNRHKVIFITRCNIKKYAKLPNYIYNKVNSGVITLTNLSDILEFNLLRNYGGLWIDATVFCTSNLPDRCFKRLYTASGGYPEYRDNISLGRWTGFIFGGDFNQPLFIFMDILFQLYWKYYNYLVDYFLIDYSLDYAYLHNIGHFKNYVENSVKSNPNIYLMNSYLNKYFDASIYKKFILTTPFFKLTYKKKFKKNKCTFYNVIINNNSY